MERKLWLQGLLFPIQGAAPEAPLPSGLSAPAKTFGKKALVKIRYPKAGDIRPGQKETVRLCPPFFPHPDVALRQVQCGGS